MSKKALIIVDVQNDFLPGGSLAVPNGDEIIPVINRIVNKFDLVVATQDWHPWNHKSFASNNSGKKQFDVGELNGKPQVMWPDHCVQMTTGAQLASRIDQSMVAAIFRKGMDPEVDSYSGFWDNDRKNCTGLESYLYAAKIKKICVCGIALDYCVKFTAFDALDIGTDTYVIRDACCSVNPDFQDTLSEMEKEGVQIVTSDRVWVI